jgi:hypothetical protein
MPRQKTLLNFLFIIAILAITNSHEQLAIDVQQWASGTYHIVIMKEVRVIETTEINMVR